MRLILTTPELQAHSVRRYADWRRVIAEHVARRTGAEPHDLLPQVACQVALAISLSAYEAWLAGPRADDPGLPALIDRAMSGLHTYLAI